ncbi:MAG TPA: FAD-binding oxidoreductase [Methylomirabilota bacterium]|nr:FAD-binding oxidoreductase [Methylomirabilota bacterium]
MSQATAIRKPDIDDLRSALRGAVLLPEDAGYDETRRIFNAMIDHRPALIARCAGAADIVTCVEFARALGLEVSMRGGGHNVSGKAVCHGGLMIDLAGMKSVRVDPRRRTVHAEPGLTLAELDRDCQRFGLATPTGIVSPTGIAGLTLGGGIGWLGGKHGLACDNLISVDIVTADGKLLTASETEHPDLFWAVRGGGANLGVVTSLEYRLHEIGPVLGGAVAWPLDQAKRVLRFYGEFAQAAPDELCANAGFATAEDGTAVLGIAVAWIGPLDTGERVLKPLRSHGSPLADAVLPMSFIDLQRGGDSAFPPGRRHYWKAGFLRRLSPEAIDVLVHFAATLPSPQTQIGLQQMHGAAARVSSTATAFAHRHDQWDCLMLTQWDRRDDDEQNIRWTRDLYARMEPHLERAVYVNDLGGDEGDRIRSAYGANYDRLAAVKAKYDQTNFFRWNQNVTTAS